MYVLTDHGVPFVGPLRMILMLQLYVQSLAILDTDNKVYDCTYVTYIGIQNRCIFLLLIPLSAALTGIFELCSYSVLEMKTPSGNVRSAHRITLTIYADAGTICQR